MNKRKNIAFLVYDISLTGGAEVITRQLAKELGKEYNVQIISLFQKNKLFNEGFGLHSVSNEVKSISFNLFSLAKGVRKIILEKQIDILFSVTAGVNSVALQAAKHTSAKVVYVEHSNLSNQTYGKKHFYRQRLGARHASHIVTLTQRDKENYIKTFKLDANAISVIPNWFENKLEESEYDVNSKKIISVGRLVPLKGYDTMLEVAKIVLKKHVDWTWDIYGDGCDREHLESKIKEFNLENNVFLKGNVSNIRELYCEYSFFVLCSRYEGIPMVMLEAQSAKLPLVSFDCQTGPREIILDRVNGELIDEGDVEGMVKAVLHLIEQPKVRQGYASHSQDNIGQFSKEVVFKKWITLIETL